MKNGDYIVISHIIECPDDHSISYNKKKGRITRKAPQEGMICTSYNRYEIQLSGLRQIIWCAEENLILDKDNEKKRDSEKKDFDEKNESFKEIFGIAFDNNFFKFINKKG